MQENQNQRSHEKRCLNVQTHTHTHTHTQRGEEGMNTEEPIEQERGIGMAIDDDNGVYVMYNCTLWVGGGYNLHGYGMVMP